MPKRTIVVLCAALSPIFCFICFGYAELTDEFATDHWI